MWWSAQPPISCKSYIFYATYSFTAPSLLHSRRRYASQRMPNETEIIRSNSAKFKCLIDNGFWFSFSICPQVVWRTENFPRLLVRWRKSQSIEPNIDSNGNRAERCHITYYRYCYACIYWIYFVSFHIFNITRWWIERKIQLAGIDVAVVAPIRSRIRDSMNEWSFRNIFYSLFILVVLIESESNALN